MGFGAAIWEITVYRALHAHLSKPATKEVDIWRVEYAFQAAPNSHSPLTWRAGSSSYEGQYAKPSAQSRAAEMEAEPERFACVRVTGPHKQKVPV